jgi:hypothetical protein
MCSDLVEIVTNLIKVEHRNPFLLYYYRWFRQRQNQTADNIKKARRIRVLSFIFTLVKMRFRLLSASRFGAHAGKLVVENRSISGVVSGIWKIIANTTQASCPEAACDAEWEDKW